MAAPATIEDFLEVVRRSNQVDTARLEAYMASRRQTEGLPGEPQRLAALLVREGLLTNFQAEQFLQGKWRGFAIGGYRILERLGSGGTGTVYLAEHQVMKRRVAIKVLPAPYAAEPGVLERFLREAQAAAALDHPNIVRAYDFRSEGGLHFLVMEYVEGLSLQELLSRQGALSLPQACDYARQAALGLQHAHEAGLVHRDVKPANLLVDVTGTVKLLDLGLARYAPEGTESLTRQFDEGVVMGTADYLAPEQALNLHAVDSRADVYSLGATLYALLAGEPPFAAGTVTQKLLWHQMREPRPLRQACPQVPEALERLVARMMVKDPARRFQSLAAVADALEPFCTGPVPPGASRSGILPGRASDSGRRAGSSARLSGVRGPHSPRGGLSPDTRVADGGDSTPRVTERRSGRHGPMPMIVKPVRRGWLIAVSIGSALAVLVAIIWLSVFLWRLADKATPAVQVAPGDGKGPGRPVVRAFQLPERAGELLLLTGHREPVRSVSFSTAGPFVLSASQDRTLRFWDLERRAAGTVLTLDGPVRSAVLARDGHRALSGSLDRTVRLWQILAFREERRYQGSTRGVLAVAFSADEQQVLAGGEDGIVRLWETGSGMLLREFVKHDKPITGVAVDPYRQRRRCLSSSEDGTLRLWNMDNGKEIRRFPGHTGPISCVVFGHDGNQAVSAGHDKTVRLWDVNTGRQLHLFTGHTAPVLAVAVSSDGRRLLSAGVDRAVKLWDLTQRRALGDFPGHTGDVTSLAFSVNGRHFVSGSADCSVRVWGVPPR
jgi:serine/threonine protein kinase